MACENFSNYYPIVMKFSGYLPLYKDTRDIDFGPDRSIPLAGHAPKVGQRIRLLDQVETIEARWGYMGHCVISIFEAIRQPVYKIIQ